LLILGLEIFNNQRVINNSTCVLLYNSIVRLNVIYTSIPEYNYISLGFAS